MRASEIIKNLTEDATGGASSAGAVSAVVKKLGETPKELVKRQQTYTNVRTKGGPVKAKK
mgnify:CR=1 FL=1